MSVFSPLFLPLTLFQSQHSSCQLLFLSCFLSSHHPQLLSSPVTSPNWILSCRYLGYTHLLSSHLPNHHPCCCYTCTTACSGVGQDRCGLFMSPGPSLPFLLHPWGRKCPGEAMQNCPDANSSSSIPRAWSSKEELF